MRKEENERTSISVDNMSCIYLNEGTMTMTINRSEREKGGIIEKKRE